MTSCTFKKLVSEILNITAYQRLALLD